MTVNKQVPQANTIVVNARQRTKRQVNIAQTLFKPLGDSFNDKTFDFLIAKIFGKFEQEGNVHYLPKKWLSEEFKKIFADKESDLYRNTLIILKIFYNIYPFNFEVTTTQILYDFFTKHHDFAKEFENADRLNSFSKNGLLETVKQFFVPLFISFLNNAATINNANYTSIKQMIINDLLRNIDQFLKSKDPDYAVNNELTPQLLKWIRQDFNYNEAQKLGLTKTYDLFLGKEDHEEILNISMTDFNQALTLEFQQNLNATTNTPLKQVVFHYLFLDLLMKQVVRPVEKGTLQDARTLIDSLYSTTDLNSPNSPVLQNLNVFLIGLKQAITKFGFYWKTNETTNGLFMEKHQAKDWLTQKDATKANYDFKFKFKFATSYVTTNENDSAHSFNIPVSLEVSPLDQAKNIVDNFINTIQWNPGYLNQPTWTEKDITEWAFNNNFNDFKALLNTDPQQDLTTTKELSKEEWSRFTSAQLENIDFSKIITNDFAFKVVPSIEFNVNRVEFNEVAGAGGTVTPNYLGSIRIVFKLLQYAKNFKVGDAPLRIVEIEAKGKSAILTMLELFNQKIMDAYPSLLNFDAWKKQDKSFWINEFINSEGNSLDMLNTKEDFLDRSNFKILESVAIRLVNKVNSEYRNNFEVAPQFEVVSNQNELGRRIDFGFAINDIAIGKSKPFSKSIYTNKMKIFGKLTQGEFKGAKGTDIILREKLQTATPLPPTIQSKPAIGSQLSDDFVFIVEGAQMTFGEILKSLREDGFQNVRASEVKWKLKDEDTNFNNFVAIFYEVEYHDFATGENKTWSQSFDLELNFNGVDQEEIENGYQNIINNIPPEKRDDEKLLDQINKLFGSLKDDPDGEEWRKDVSREEYEKIIASAIDLIAKFRPGDDIIKEIEKIYDNNVPSKIISKFSDPKFLNAIKEILKHKDDFSLESIKKIIENEQLLDFLKNQEKSQIKNLIIKTLKLTKNAKYSYLGAGIGLGAAGLLAGATSLRTLRLNLKTKMASTKFKKSKYISILSLGASILSVCASTTLILLFFIEKGGF